MKIHLKIRNAVENVGSAFDGSAIYTVLDEHFEQSARHDGLADDGVRPGNRIAFGVKSSGKTIVPFRTIPAAAEVVFACPDHFHSGFGDLCDVDRFDDEV